MVVSVGVVNGHAGVVSVVDGWFLAAPVGLAFDEEFVGGETSLPFAPGRALTEASLVAFGAVGFLITALFLAAASYANLASRVASSAPWRQGVRAHPGAPPAPARPQWWRRNPVTIRGHGRRDHEPVMPETEPGPAMHSPGRTRRGCFQHAPPAGIADGNEMTSPII